MVWRPSVAMSGWLIAGVVLSVLGLLARRPEITALGVPFLVGVAWSISRRPRRGARVEVVAADQPVSAGGMSARVVLDADPAAGVIALRIAAPGHRRVEALVAAELRAVTVTMTSVRTGRRDLFRVDHRESGPDLLLETSATSEPAARATVLPRTRSLGQLPLPLRLQGLTGPHPSRRTGDGGELSDVGLFRPGDRMRRIDWRVTARLNHGQSGITELYVRRTNATADATVMLVIDSRDDLGPRITTWSDATLLREDEATSLDIARSAAASLAAAYLSSGNRVGLEDLGRLRRPVPPAGGRAQQQRLLHRLALSVPEGEPVSRHRIPRLPSGALIIVLSTFLDDDAARMATSWRHIGHRVVAVDTLPAIVLLGANERTEAAYRIVAMERHDRIQALSRAAVEIVSWRLVAEPDPAQQLELLARARMRR